MKLLIISNTKNSLFIRLIYHFFQVNNLVAISISIGINIWLYYFGFYKGYEIFDILISIFLLFTLFSILLGKYIDLSLFLFFLSFPLVNFLIFKSQPVGIVIFGVLINWTLIHMIIIIYKFRYIPKIRFHFNLVTITVIFIIIFSSIFSITNSLQSYVALNSILYGFILPIFIYYYFRNRAITKNFLDDFLDISILSFVILNLVFISFALLGLIGVDIYDSRYSGFVNSPNTFAPWALIILSFIFMRIKQNKFSLLYLFSMVFTIFLILLTGTRAALILMSLILMYFTVFKNLTSIFSIIKWILYFSLFYLVLTFIVNDVMDLLVFQRYVEYGFSSGRIEIWKQSIEYISSKNYYFYGTGMGNFLFSTYSTIGRSTPHNSILNLAVSIGLISSVLYHVFIVSHLINNKSSRASFDYKFIILIILAYMVFETFEPMYFDRQDPALFLVNDIMINSMNTNIYVILSWAILGISSKVRSNSE